MEKIIISLTTWPARDHNLPKVLKSIMTQTHKPDLICVNLSSDEYPLGSFPEDVKEQLQMLSVLYAVPIELYYVQGNTKVWKKFIPTMQRFPDDCIICIDDDIIYPSDFIETLYNAHLEHPNNPIGSMYVVRFGSIQHCGSGTLDKLEFYGNMLNHPIPTHLKSSDTYYNYWAQKSGHPVLWCGKDFQFTSFNETQPWSTSPFHSKKEAWKYCLTNFGPVKGERPKVFYFVPWSSAKNIGETYNSCAALVPEDGYICFVDADTIFTTSDYGTIIENTLMTYPDIEAFTCKTNRVACTWQVAQQSDWNDDDMRHHRELGEYYRDTNGTICKDRTDARVFSGLFLCIKKSAWDAIGGAPDGMLGVDNEIHRRLRKHGMRLYQMMGLYLYHWYRGGDKSYTKHLKP